MNFKTKIQSTIAAILLENNRDLIIDEIGIAKNLSDGQVLVQLITAGICGAQISEINALKGPDKYLPHLLGHEGYCEILQVGPGVRTLSEGDHAVMHWRPGSGIQSNPAEYMWNGSRLNSGLVTTFNQHAIVSENRLTKVQPNEISNQLYPLLGCSLTTALGLLEREAKVTFRDKIIIIGAGGVGLSIIQAAKLFNTEVLLVIDNKQEKLDIARKLGCTQTLLVSDKMAIYKESIKMLDGLKPTVAIDTTGINKYLELCYELSAHNSRTILVGVPKFDERSSFNTLPLHHGKIIMGSNGGSSNPDEDIPVLMNALKNNLLNFSNFPTTKIKLEEINDGISKMKMGSPGRFVINF
jgi:Zn-dependent alcohol dehydrogenase